MYFHVFKNLSKKPFVYYLCSNCPRNFSLCRLSVRFLAVGPLAGRLVFLQRLERGVRVTPEGRGRHPQHLPLLGPQGCCRVGGIVVLVRRGRLRRAHAAGRSLARPRCHHHSGGLAWLRMFRWGCRRGTCARRPLAAQLLDALGIGGAGNRVEDGQDFLPHFPVQLVRQGDGYVVQYLAPRVAQEGRDQR